MNVDQLLLLAWVRDVCTSGEARRIREHAGISQSMMAAAVGVTTPTVHRWETRSRTPTGDAALRYADALRRLQRAAAKRVSV